MEGPAPNSVAAPAPTGGDWRSQLRDMAREVMVKRIMQALKKHLPIRDSDWLTRFQNIAKGFEQKFYTTAPSQSSYSRKIAMLLLYVETPNQNSKHRAPGLPPPGNNPAQSPAAHLMSQQKTQQGNTSTSMEASSLPSLDEKGKAPMPDSPGEESFDQEFWNSSLFATGSDDKTQHPGADTADKFELADPSENTLLMVDKCTAADHVFYEYPGISFVEYQNFLDTLEESLNYESMFDGTTNPKRRKFDGASSPAPVFGEATSGPMYGHSSFQW